MRILVGDNDADTRRAVETGLADGGYEVVTSEDGADAWRVLQGDDPPKLCVLDRSLPIMDGLEICRSLRELRKRPHIYVIMMLSHDREAQWTEAMEVGADDFVAKPVDLLELTARVRAGSRIVRLQGTFMSFLDHYESQSVTDPLTGLWSDSTIVNILQNEAARSARQGIPVSLLLGQLSGPPHSTESDRHLTADAIIREVGRRLHSSVRTYDSVGLMEGKTFVIVAPGCDAAHVKRIAERLRTTFKQFTVGIGDDAVTLSMSFGAVTVAGQQDRDAASLIDCAGKALQAAQAKGDNRVEVWEETTDNP